MRLVCDQSRRHGEAFGGLSPPNKAPSPPNLNMKHYKSVEILQIFRVSSPPEQTQSPPQKRKKLSGKLSGYGSVCDWSDGTQSCFIFLTTKLFYFDVLYSLRDLL